MKVLLKALLVSLLTVFTTYAATLPEPEGRVVLTITGAVENTQDGTAARFDLAQLKSLESATFNLHTRWTDRVHEYKGPLLTAVLATVGAKGTVLRLTALNDYSIDIDRTFVEKYQPILALQDDGKKMSLRDKGPLWLLLPHDKYPELNSEENTGKMIWQLHQIEIL